MKKLIAEGHKMDEMLNAVVSRIKLRNGFFIDIGASDGISSSNSYFLSNKKSWKGISIECDDNKYLDLCKNQPREEVIKLKEKVTVDNIIHILQQNNAPKKIDFLSIDIDGYDYYILNEILDHYVCETIIAEVNEKIPVPIKFSVCYNVDHFWDTSHFYGMSLSKLEQLAEEKNYTITDYCSCNAIMTHSDYLPEGFQKQTISSLYDNGYKNRKDLQPHWNDDVKHWLHMNPDDALNDIKKYFDVISNRTKIGYTITL